MPEDFYGPLRPALGWTLLGGALVALVIGWFAWVWWTTRPPRRTSSPATETRRFDPAEWQARTLAEIDRLEAAHAAGHLSARDVFQGLSPLVRRYVHETSGAPVHVRSLDDLRAGADPALVATVEWMYPEEFAPDAPGAGGPSCRPRSWNRAMPFGTWIARVT